jgi:molybdopterin converting factor small subunit
MQGITVMAFGHISSLLGAREVVLDCGGALPVSAILDELRSRYPLFSDYLGQLKDVEEYLLILVDSREMQMSSLVQPGEELVLVTPVSGG